MTEPTTRQTHRAEVASHIPGRLRVRLSRGSRQPHVFHQLKTALENRQGVHHVEINPLAGSMTVQYDPQSYQGTDIFAVLEDLKVIITSVMDVPHVEIPEQGGPSSTAVTLAGALDDLDRRFSALTGRTLDLRVLFPLSLAGIGAWLIRENGLMIEMVPGWFLVWLAFDAFVKLNPHSAAAPVAQQVKSLKEAGKAPRRGKPAGSQRQPRQQVRQAETPAQTVTDPVSH